MKNKQNSVTQIKCNFSNEVHKLIDPTYGIKNTDKWRQKEVLLTEKEKVELFDKILKLDKETSRKVTGAYYKRRARKKVERDRIARGYVATQRTPIKVWLQYQDANVDIPFKQWLEEQDLETSTTVGELELAD